VEYARQHHTDTINGFNFVVGTIPYEGYPTVKEYFDKFNAASTRTNRDLFYDHLPVSAGGNIYFNGARPCTNEKDAKVVTGKKVTCKLVFVDAGWKLDTDYFRFLDTTGMRLIDTYFLGEAFEPEEKFENPDGTPILFDSDYSGGRSQKRVAGPVCDAKDLESVLAVQDVKA